MKLGEWRTSLRDWDTVARPRVRELRGSQIRAVANASVGKGDVLPFWFGEPDLITPEPIRRRAIAEIEQGNCFYAPTLGIPALRQALSEYLTQLCAPIGPERVAITSSGTSALMTAVQAIIDPGDTVVVVTPVWPNLCEMPKVLGAQVRTVALGFSNLGWRLDLDELISAITPDVKALLINSPNNPTGWTIDRAAQTALLDRCRETGTWIVADDVYERLVFSGRRAPSFLDIADPDDRVVSCNSFSKTWQMTGWRLGWAVVPEPMMEGYGKLIEYNTTCAPPFTQVAAIEAVRYGEAQLRVMIDRLSANQARLRSSLARLPDVELGAPAAGAMYSFFKVRGMSDALAFCRALVEKVGLGLAPGSAFGDEFGGFVRWCFASEPDRLDQGAERLALFLARDASALGLIE